MKDLLHIEKEIVIFKGKKYECTGDLCEVKNTYPDWNAEKDYHAGDKVSYKGLGYEANWWTKNQIPEEHNGKQGSGEPWLLIDDQGSLEPVAPKKPTQPSKPVAPKKLNGMQPAKSSLWPEKVLVGYVTTFGDRNAGYNPVTNEMITHAISNGYNVFVYAFAEINKGNKVSLSGISDSDLSNQIKEIKNNHGVTLISFGGAINTFDPNGKDVDGAASSTVEFCRKHGFNGVDLDLETISVDVKFLVSYINKMRELKADLIVTAAPQIQGGYGGPASLAPGSIFTTDFLNEAAFNALLVQNYNQYGGAVFNQLQDTDEGFISASFKKLQEFVPPFTKIVVGEPANEKAGSGLHEPGKIVADITNGNLISNPRYGGIMTWAINYDYEQEWIFAKGVKSVV